MSTILILGYWGLALTQKPDLKKKLEARRRKLKICT
jgi:hypothetical protein